MTTGPDSVTYSQTIGEVGGPADAVSWQSTARPALPMSGMYGYAADIDDWEFRVGSSWLHAAWLDKTTTQSFVGPVTVNTAGAAAVSISSGQIIVPTSQSLALQVRTAGQSITMGATAAGLGNALTVTVNANGNTAGGASPNTVTVGNVISAPFYKTPGNTYTLSGSTVLQPFLMTTNFAGSTSGILRPYQFNISSDTVDALSASTAPTAVTITHNVGGVGTKGGRIAFQPTINVNAAISGDTSQQQYQPVYSQAQASVNVGGTNTSSGSRGFLYGTSAQAILYSGATNWSLINGGGEIDVMVETGASVRDIYGLSIIFLSGHGVAGAGENQAIAIASQNGALASWTRGLGFGNNGGDWSFASTASLIGTTIQTTYGGAARSAKLPPQLATRGIELDSVNFSQQSGSFLRGPAFDVDGTGQANVAGGLFFGTNATGYKVDVPAVNTVTAMAISVSGTGSAGLNNYYPGDLVYGTSSPTKGQYLVATTKVLNATVVSGGTGGTPGAVTIVGTTGTGTKFQATGTINGSGVLTGALVVTVAGNYTVNPTTPAAEPVTGGGLSGCTVSLGIGVLTATILVPDVSTGTAATITPTGGSGAGLILTPTWSTRDGITYGGATTKQAFFGGTPASKPTVTGSKGANAALASLMTALSSLGLVTDTTT